MADQVKDEDDIQVKDDIRPLAVINCSDFVVAHSNVIMRPARNISEAPLLPCILEGMQKYGLNRMRRIQSHAWPHLTGNRRRGAMIVGGPGSGRSCSYIPPVCDAVCRTIQKAQHERASKSSLDLPGALALILVPNVDRANQVGSLIYTLLINVINDENKNMKNYKLAQSLPSTKNINFIHALLNGVACVVGTPEQMIFVWKELQGLMQFPNLKYVVYDDVDLMDPVNLNKAHLIIKQLVPINCIFPQLVITSQTYIHHEMRKLKLLIDEPALIFGDILEAALYGQTRIRIAIKAMEDKMKDVLKTLQHRPPTKYTTMIYCINDVEMRCLVEYLVVGNNYSCLPYFQTSPMGVLERVHKWMENSNGTILLATDNCPELVIRQAHTLIHYNMSSTWSQFKMRFFAIAGNLTDSLYGEGDDLLESGLSLFSLVLLDDSNYKQLPRLVEFLQKHQQIDKPILEVAEQIRKKQARLRADRNVVCRQIMNVGNCIASGCEERHDTDSVDRWPASMPALTGDIKVKLLRVYSPNHFCVHIYQHLPGPDQGWQKMHQRGVSGQYLYLQLLQPDEDIRYWPPVAGAICLYKNVTGFMERVRVLKVETIKNVNLSDATVKVLLQAIDVDTRIFHDFSGKLFKCSERLQAELPLAIDLRLCGIVPHSGGRDWPKSSHKSIEEDLEQLPDECFLQANVLFATSHTIYARCLTAVIYCRVLKVHIPILDVVHRLITSKMGKMCEQTKEKIRAFFEDVLEVPMQTDQEMVSVEENTKENNAPNKPALLKQQRGAAKEAEAIIIKQVKQDNKEDEDYIMVEDEPKLEPKNKLYLSELYECMINCAVQHNEDKTLTARIREYVLSTQSQFLNELVNGPPAADSSAAETVEKRKKTKRSKPKTTTPAEFMAAHRSPLQMQLDLPVDLVRPRTTYYQTHTTLELQVELPDVGYNYNVQLLGKQVIFHAEHLYSTFTNVFTVALGVAYNKLEHRMNGRTVYVTVYKTVGGTDQVHYQAYNRFLRLNYDKFDLMARSVEMYKLEMFKRYSTEIPRNNTQSDDEDEDMPEVEANEDGTERPDADVMGED